MTQSALDQVNSWWKSGVHEHIEHELKILFFLCGHLWSWQPFPPGWPCSPRPLHSPPQNRQGCRCQPASCSSGSPGSACLRLCVTGNTKESQISQLQLLMPLKLVGGRFKSQLAMTWSHLPPSPSSLLLSTIMCAISFLDPSIFPNSLQWLPSSLLKCLHFSFCTACHVLFTLPSPVKNYSYFI